MEVGRTLVDLFVGSLAWHAIDIEIIELEYHRSVTLAGN